MSIDYKLSIIIRSLDKIEKEIQNIRIRISSIEEKIGLVEHQGEKMSGHIDFINNIYDNIRLPLSFFTTQISRIANYSSISLLPELVADRSSARVKRIADQ